MTPREIDALLQLAETEFNQGETAMLIAPLAVIGLIEQLRTAERKIDALAAYDELHG